MAREPQDTVGQSDGANSTGQPKSDWNLWAERALMEQLAAQRLNFLLLFVGLTIAGSTTSISRYVTFALLLAGTVVCGLMGLTVSRAFREVSDLRSVIESAYQNADVVRQWKAFGKSWRLLGSNTIQGTLIPPILTLWLAGLSVIAYLFM
jgi:hypothetical protein